MIAVVQRVSSASVAVSAQDYCAQIGTGLMILLGIEQDDDDEEIRWGAEKCAHLRIFEDDAGKMNRSLLEIGGEALVVSQFTLAGACSKGRRPSFIKAAPPERANTLYERFCSQLALLGIPVKTGIFQATMQVRLVNEGPVTLIVQRDRERGAIQ